MRQCGRVLVTSFIYAICKIGCASRASDDKHDSNVLAHNVGDKHGRLGPGAKSKWLWLSEETKQFEIGKARKKYMDDKLLIERMVTQNFVNKSIFITTSQNASVKTMPKIAFLFLIRDDFDWTDIWAQFFNDAPRDTYSIYVHQSELEQEPQDVKLPLENWGAIRVPRVPSAWCACFGVEVAMLWKALQDPMNTQFVFLSEWTVPLKRFSYVYRHFIQVSPTTSKFCLATAAEHDTMAGETAEQVIYGRCLFRDFYRRQNPRTLKHHQWVVLARRHATIIVRRASEALDLFEKSWRRAAPDIRTGGEGCSDECAPLTALLYELEVAGKSSGNIWTDFTRIGVEQQCLTFVHWRNCFGGTTLDRSDLTADLGVLWSNGWQLWEYLPDTSGGFNYDFMKTPLKRSLNGFPFVLNQVDITYLEALVNEGFMFARKFAIGANVTTEHGPVPLNDVLPALWYNVEEKTASKKVWMHLETSGQPMPLTKP